MMSGEDEDMENMYGGIGMYGGILGGADPQIPTDPRVIWSRRRLKYQLTCVKRGLAGMAIAGESSQHEKVVAQVAEAVEAALALTDPPEDKPDLEGLTESIQKGLRGLAFLAPEAAEIGVQPLTELPPDAAPATPAAAGEPAAAAAVDSTAPATEGAAPPDLPPGVE